MSTDQKKTQKQCTVNVPAYKDIKALNIKEYTLLKFKMESPEGLTSTQSNRMRKHIFNIMRIQFHIKKDTVDLWKQYVEGDIDLWNNHIKDKIDALSSVEKRSREDNRQFDLYSALNDYDDIKDLDKREYRRLKNKKSFKGFTTAQITEIRKYKFRHMLIGEGIEQRARSLWATYLSGFDYLSSSKQRCVNSQKHINKYLFTDIMTEYRRRKRMYLINTQCLHMLNHLYFLYKDRV